VARYALGMAESDFSEVVSALVWRGPKGWILTLETVDSPERDLGHLSLNDFGDDFFDAGLNQVGPLLNRRGLAYDSWQELEPGRYAAMLYLWDESDPWGKKRRAFP